MIQCGNMEILDGIKNTEKAKPKGKHYIENMKTSYKNSDYSVLQYFKHIYN